jgi:hypothetical protein
MIGAPAARNGRTRNSTKPGPRSSLADVRENAAPGRPRSHDSVRGEPLGSAPRIGDSPDPGVGLITSALVAPASGPSCALLRRRRPRRRARSQTDEDHGGQEHTGQNHPLDLGRNLRAHLGEPLEESAFRSDELQMSARPVPPKCTASTATAQTSRPAPRHKPTNAPNSCIQIPPGWGDRCFELLRSLASENPQVTCSLSFSPLRLRPHVRVAVAPKRRVRPRSQSNDRIEPASRPQRSRPRTRPQHLPPDGPAGAISGWSDEALALLRRRCFHAAIVANRRSTEQTVEAPSWPRIHPICRWAVLLLRARFAGDAESERLHQVAVYRAGAKYVASAVPAQRSCPGEEISIRTPPGEGCVFSRRRSRLPRSEGDPTRACA